MVIRIVLGSFVFALVLVWVASWGGPSLMLITGVLLSWPLARFVVWKPSSGDVVLKASFNLLLLLALLSYALAWVLVADVFGLAGVVALGSLSIIGFALLHRRMPRR